MTRVEELFKQVQALSPDEREEFELLLGADGEDFELSPEWKAEIKRRIEDLESGRTKTIPWHEVQRRLERRLDGESWD